MCLLLCWIWIKVTNLYLAFAVCCLMYCSILALGSVCAKGCWCRHLKQIKKIRSCIPETWHTLLLDSATHYICSCCAGQSSEKCFWVMEFASCQNVLIGKWWLMTSLVGHLVYTIYSVLQYDYGSRTGSVLVKQAAWKLVKDCRDLERKRLSCNTVA